ncbi:SMI1/KNR4 family protein [Pseudomonas asplenii]|uniref:SMI1/KNR4 family protein n=1 Tax=Pseudomonas asplenii TaxID=53407 RepID=UPI0022347440|nr:SMI1/KNR4 family protein [Pseudomonas asplenii]UZE31256.1 SMI1/KNR4 family protein [Pseudomonas asplenii]
MMSRVRQIFFDLERSGCISKDILLGCNEEEIFGVEKKFNCVLPVAYRDFLSVAGRSAGKLFFGTDIFYPGVLELDLATEELFSESGRPDFYPGEAKIFCMHQGYEILFFIPGADDPPVFQYVEGDGSITRPWSSFSDFLRGSIEDHLAQWSDLNFP